MDVSKAIEFAQLLYAASVIPPDNVTNSAGTSVTAGGTAYTVVTTIYANDLATDMNPNRTNNIVSIGLIYEAEQTGDVVVAIRGTDGILEWVHDAEFLLVPCPFLVGAGKTEDGFTAMYNSLRTAVSPGSPTVVSALATLPYKHTISSMTICGHSLGGAIATLLALDVAANTKVPNPTVYTYASPRTGDPSFVVKYNKLLTNSYRIANRLDVVPKLPLPPVYDHVAELYELNPMRLLPLPPKILVKPTLDCEHSLVSYLYLLSVVSGGLVLPLDQTCVP